MRTVRVKYAAIVISLLFLLLKTCVKLSSSKTCINQELSLLRQLEFSLVVGIKTSRKLHMGESRRGVNNVNIVEQKVCLQRISK